MGFQRRNADHSVFIKRCAAEVFFRVPRPKLSTEALLLLEPSDALDLVVRECSHKAKIRLNQYINWADACLSQE